MTFSSVSAMQSVPMPASTARNQSSRVQIADAGR